MNTYNYSLNETPVMISLRTIHDKDSLVINGVHYYKFRFTISKIIAVNQRGQTCMLFSDLILMGFSSNWHNF